MSNSESNGIIKRTLSRRKFSMIAGGSVLLAACGDGDSAAPAATTTTAAPATTTEAAAPAVTTTIAPATTTTVAATTTTAAGAAPTTTTTAAPRPLKTLRYGYHAATTSADTLDPAYRTSSTDGLFQTLVAEQLVRLDENLTPTPHLAESWEPNDDGTEWTFNLREGITFHDGKPFVAADVVYTYQRLLDPDVASPGAGNLPGLEPDGITAPDDYTVVMRLTAPNVDWPEAITNSHTRIVPEGATNADLAAQSLGTGAYRIDEFIPGEISTVFERNENYWQPGFPKVDFLEIIAIGEAEARLAAIRQGQVDILSEVPSGVGGRSRDRPRHRDRHQPDRQLLGGLLPDRCPALRQQRPAPGHQVRHQPPSARRPRVRGTGLPHERHPPAGVGPVRAGGHARARRGHGQGAPQPGWLPRRHRLDAHPGRHAGLDAVVPGLAAATGRGRHQRRAGLDPGRHLLGRPVAQQRPSP